jgi:protein-tyrosine phosphatase
VIKRLKDWLQGEPDARATNPDAVPGRRVLMVCMGNICRSPTAEGVLRAKLGRAGLLGRVLVDSAGTHGYHSGEAPDPRAIRHAALRGYDISQLRARPVQGEDFERFDWILAMDEDNLDWLRRRAPEGLDGRIGLLMTHARRHTAAARVPDPYYGTPAGFEHVLDLVEDACDGLVERLNFDLGIPSKSE